MLPSSSWLLFSISFSCPFTFWCHLPGQLPNIPSFFLITLPFPIMFFLTLLHFVLTISSCTFHIPLSMPMENECFYSVLPPESKLWLHLMNEARPPCHSEWPCQTVSRCDRKKQLKRKFCASATYWSRKNRNDNCSCVFSTVSTAFLYSSFCYLWFFI